MGHQQSGSASTECQLINGAAAHPHSVAGHQLSGNFSQEQLLIHGAAAHSQISEIINKAAAHHQFCE